MRVEWYLGLPAKVVCVFGETVLFVCVVLVVLVCL